MALHFLHRTITTRQLLNATIWWQFCIYLVPSSIHYAEESEKKREERRRRRSAVTLKTSSKQTNKHQGISDLRKKKHNSRRDEKQKRTMNHRQKSRNPRCNPFVDPHIRACLLTRPVSPRLTWRSHRSRPYSPVFCFYRWNSFSLFCSVWTYCFFFEVLLSSFLILIFGILVDARAPKLRHK